LKDKITAREYQNWKRFYQVSGPFGQERADYHTALIVQTLQEVKNTIIAVNGGNAEQLRPLEDYLLKFQRITQDSTDDQARQEGQNIRRFLARGKRKTKN
jgi:hypothetical protein